MKITKEITDTLPNFYSMRQVRNLHESKGMFFFSEGAKRFFKSRISDCLYGGCVFVTSERSSWNAPRLYTVRMIDIDGDIRTLGDFQGFSTRAKAHTYAKNIGDEINQIRKK